MKIQLGYIVVRRINPSKLSLDFKSIHEYQRCEAIAVSLNSKFVKGDELLMAENAYFAKAEEFGKDAYYIYEDEVYGCLREGKLYPSKDYVYISADKNSKSVLNGIFKDIRYNPLAKDNVTQHGVVEAVCLEANDSYYGKKLKVEIEPGDKIYCHHFLTEADSEREVDGKKFYEILYENIYCKIGEDIEMLNDWNLVTPIKNELKTTESGLILETHKRNEAQTAIVQHPNSHSGFYPGDKVLFKKGREYEIDVEGRTYYRINNQDIIYNLDKMKALNDIVVIDPIRKERTVGDLTISVTKEKHPDKGRVVSPPENDPTIKEGDEVLFRKGAATHVTIEGEERMLIDRKNVYVIL